jgi:hypothetical protein
VHKDESSGLLNGGVSLENSMICHLEPTPRQEDFKFTQDTESDFEISCNGNGSATKRQRDYWRALISFPDYNEPREGEENHEDDNGSEESIPCGEIKVIAERHACPWIPKEQPQEYYDSQLLSFNTVQEAENAVAGLRYSTSFIVDLSSSTFLADCCTPNPRICRMEAIAGFLS